jgi:hypothetical protein
MEMSDLKTRHATDGPKITMDDIIDDLFHDAQNSIHRVGMELELASMGLADKSNAAKAAEMIKSLDNNVRDLRAYISSLQNPSATCDPATVVQGVVANLQMGRRSPRVQLNWIAPEAALAVPMHRKLLARVMERVLDFCENAMPRGGELRIAADPLEAAGQSHVKITLTLLSTAPLPQKADKDFLGDSSDPLQFDRDAARALEVLRRHHGEVSFCKASDCQCEISFRMPASPR